MPNMRENSVIAKLRSEKRKVVFVASILLFACAMTFLFHERQLIHDVGYKFRNGMYLFQHFSFTQIKYPEAAPPSHKILNPLFFPVYYLFLNQQNFVPQQPILWLVHFLFGKVIDPGFFVFGIINILSFSLGIIYLFKLFNVLFKDKYLGALGVVLLITSPWFCAGLRSNFGSAVQDVCVGFAVWYYFLKLMENEALTRTEGILFSFFTIFYLASAPDFPIPFFFLLVYAFSEKKIKRVLFNRYTALPIIIILVLLAVAIAASFFERATGVIIVGKFFFRATRVLEEKTFQSYLFNFHLLLKTYGIHIALATFGAIAYFSRANSDKKLFALITLYFLLTCALYVIHGGVIQYEYIICIPSVILAGYGLSALKKPFRWAVIAILFGAQILFFFTYDYPYYQDARLTYDRETRYMAAAYTLLEDQRDIQAKGERIEKNPYYLIAPRDYDNDVKVCGDYFLAELIGDLTRLSVTSHAITNGDTKACMDSFSSIAHDEPIYFLLRGDDNDYGKVLDSLEKSDHAETIVFKDAQGRKLLLGIVPFDGATSSKTESLDAEPIADKYLSKYYNTEFFEKRIPYDIHP